MTNKGKYNITPETVCSVSEADALIKPCLKENKCTLKKAFINVSLLYLMIIFDSAYIKLVLMFYLCVAHSNLRSH